MTVTNISDNLQIPQKEGIIKPEDDASGKLYVDVFGIKTLTDLTSSIVKKISPDVRKKILDNYLANNNHETFTYKTVSGINTNIWVIDGARYEGFEFHIAEKLAKSGQHVLFPNHGAFGNERRNDVFLYDAKTYIQQKVEMKALFGETAEALRSQLISGSGQAGVIAYDIQSNIKKMWLIDGLRKGWSKNTKKVLINYRGQWYQIEHDLLFSDNIYMFLK